MKVFPEVASTGTKKMGLQSVGLTIFCRFFRQVSFDFQKGTSGMLKLFFYCTSVLASCNKIAKIRNYLHRSSDKIFLTSQELGSNK